MVEPLAGPNYSPPAEDLRSSVVARYWFASLIACLTVAGAGLRFIKLGESYWYDEAVTVGLVRSSLDSMIHALPGSESTPPLYYGIAWVWSRLFGTSEVALRSLSVLLGAAAIPLAAAAGREFFSKAAGALAAALVAASPFLVWYSQEARAYALYVVLSALSLLLFARALKAPSRRRLAWWALASALAIWTEYFAGFLVAAEAVILLLHRRSRRQLTLPLVGLVASTAILLPLVYKQARNGRNGWIGQRSLHSRLEQTTSWFLGFPPHVWWVATAVGVLLLATIALAGRRDRRVMLMLVGLSGAAVILPLASLVVDKDYWLYRNVIDAWVPLAVALAGGVVSRGRAPSYARALLALLALAGVALLTLKSTNVVSDPHKRVDWRGLARCLGPPQPGRVFFVAPSFDGVVLKLYRPNVQPPPVGAGSMSEIDLIGETNSVRVPRGFHSTGRICTHTIAVLRLRARMPVAVPRRIEGAGVLVDAPATTT
jgi:mannosyltransferase